jgi:hypothetical protein
MVLPGWTYEWVICDLTFFPKEDLTSPIPIEIEQFSILDHEGEMFPSYVFPDVYAGQLRDISGGVSLAGPEPAFGVVAFQVYPGDIDGPFIVGWAATGNFLIADELEPGVGEIFIRDMPGL